MATNSADVSARLRDHYAGYSRAPSEWARAGALAKAENLLALAGAVPHDSLLEIGCGEGSLLQRVAELGFARQLAGIDISAASVEAVRGRRIPGLVAEIFDGASLPFPDQSFDLVVCRHMLQAVPTPERVIAEMVRVARPGGRVHLLVEDYDMIHASGTGDVSSFWHVAPRVFGGATGTDLYIGRNAIGHLRKLPVDDIHVQYAIVDTDRVR